STLVYDALNRRAKKSTGTDSTVYVGDFYERRTTSAGIEHVFHVPGIAQIDTSEATGTTRVHYLLSDALGSVTAVADDSGQLENTFYYEPFGKRINTDGTDYTGSVGVLKLGFTSQEHDDEFGLINFKGRLYDPQLKRMLSPDPSVTFPLAPQNWN